MLISVVLAVYNDARYVADAIDRVLGQVGVDIQLVVVDDGSTDGSRAIARAAADRDPRVTLIELPHNVGVALARKHGVLEAKGDWVWFVDCDDHWEPDSAARLAAAVAQCPETDVVVARARYTFESGRSSALLDAPSGPPVAGREAFGLLLSGRITGHLWNKLFRRALLLRTEFTPARVQSDLALVAQALASAARVSFLPVHVYDYRVRRGSIITSGSSRADSLQLIAGAVASAAGRLEPPVVDTDEYRYFITRYLTLSGMKDAVLGPYSSAERKRHVRRLRSRLGLRELVLLARRRDLKRLALAVSARLSLPAFRRLLAVSMR